MAKLITDTITRPGWRPFQQNNCRQSLPHWRHCKEKKKQLMSRLKALRTWQIEEGKKKLRKFYLLRNCEKDGKDRENRQSRGEGVCEREAKQQNTSQKKL